jgi:tRNA guanosine-2'-O-methyltransferase
MDVAIAEIIQSVQPELHYSIGRVEEYETACIYDALNRLPPDVEFKRKLLSALLQPWINQKPKSPIVSRWKTTVQLQMILIVSESCTSDMEAEECISHLNNIVRVLGLEALPRYRYLLEWTILRIYCVRPDMQKYSIKMLEDQEASADLNPKLMASLMKIATRVACLPKSTEAFALELMTRLIPLSASPKIAIRYEAQWSFPQLWEHAVTREWASVTSNPAFEHLTNYIRGLEKYKTPPPERVLEAFDPIADHTLANLFMGPYLQLYPPEAEKVSTTDFEDVWQDDERLGIRVPESTILLGTPPPDLNEGDQSDSQEE